jgi:putative effector of murein hydrolase LrgA (UPF0299 family)
MATWVLDALVIFCLVAYMASWVVGQMGVPIPDIAERAGGLILLLTALIFLVVPLAGWVERLLW